MELTKEYLDKKFDNLDKKFENVATKDDLKGLATIASVDSLRDFIYRHTVTREEIREMMSGLSTKEETNRILTVVDGLAGRLKRG